MQLPLAVAADEAAVHVPPAGGAEAGAGQVPPLAAVAAELAFACTVCDKQFTSKRGLLCHGTHAHARQRPSARFVVTFVCPGCGNDYRTRLRAMGVCSVQGCCVGLAVVEGGMGLVPHDPAVVAAADDADRMLRHQARKAGRSELAGPPARLHRGA